MNRIYFTLSAVFGGTIRNLFLEHGGQDTTRIILYIPESSISFSVLLLSREHHLANRVDGADGGVRAV